MTIIDRTNLFLMYTLFAYLLFVFFHGLYSITSQTPGQLESVIGNVAISLLAITSGLTTMALSHFDCQFKVAMKHFFGIEKKPELIVDFKGMRISSKILLSCGYFLLVAGGLMLMLSIFFAPLLTVN